MEQFRNLKFILDFEMNKSGILSDGFLPVSGSQYAGKWYALQKKDPEGLFLQDNISVEYILDDDGTMTASSKGRVTLFGSAAVLFTIRSFIYFQ